MSAEALDFPASRGGCPFTPPVALAELSRETPVGRITLRDGSRAWLVTRHADVRALLRDERFSSSPDHPNFPFINEGLKAQTMDAPARPFVRLDGAEHVRYRNALTAEFTPRRVEELRPRIQRVVDDYLDAMIRHGSPADLLSEFALPMPSLVICELLGVDYQNREFFLDRSGLLLKTAAEPGQLQRALDELVGYLTDLVERKRRHPDDDIVSRLAAGNDLSDAEIAVTSMFLLIAGHETTANQITMSTLALLRNPEQLAAVRARPELVVPAVEELLRYVSITHSGVPRVATEDVTVSGQLITAGDGVLCVLDTANHDESAFHAPATLDITRVGRSHVAFGFGVHQCLGLQLARVELQVALESLLRRLAGLRLDVGMDDLRFREDGAVYGVHELPIAW
jgi:cytochrome P450